MELKHGGRGLVLCGRQHILMPMGSWLRALFLLMVIFAPVNAVSQPALAAAEARAVREVIEAQIEAFRKDDAAKAFSLATPGIRELFGSPERFIEMVRASYAVVYRPASVAFDAPVLIKGNVFQPVRMTDSQGRAWLALYPMQRQPDGHWRTNGCQLARLPGQQI